MISNKLINAVLKSADVTNIENIIKELIKHFNIVYDYNDNYKNHILEMLVDNKAIITEDDIDVSYVKNNINNFIYKPEKYNIKDVTFKYIDNIECVVAFDYKYIEKINEDKEDITYTNGTININYIDYPQVLKKS